MVEEKSEGIKSGGGGGEERKNDGWYDEVNESGGNDAGLRVNMSGDEKTNRTSCP